MIINIKGNSYISRELYKKDHLFFLLQRLFYLGNILRSRQGDGTLSLPYFFFFSLFLFFC